MENGQSKKSEKKSVEPLPNNESDFWKSGKYRAEQEIFKLGKDLTCSKANHYFEYKSGIEAECKKCKIGFNLTGEYKVIDGHIYIDSTLLI